MSIQTKNYASYASLLLGACWHNSVNTGRETPVDIIDDNARPLRVDGESSIRPVRGPQGHGDKHHVAQDCLQVVHAAVG